MTAVTRAGAAILATRAVSSHGYDFAPLDVDGSTSAHHDGTMRFGPGYFVCDPGLPHRAVVTKVQFTVRDEVFDSEITCGLFRSDLTVAGAGTYEALATVPGSGVGDEPNTVRLSTTLIAFPTIDNTKYAYWLQCHIPVDGALGVYGATVTYTITSANG